MHVLVIGLKVIGGLVFLWIAFYVFMFLLGGAFALFGGRFADQYRAQMNAPKEDLYVTALRSSARLQYNFPRELRATIDEYKAKQR